MVPLRQAGEARLVAGIDVIGLASITQLVAFLRDEPMPLVDPIEVMGDPAKHAKRRLTWRMWSVRPRRSGPAK